MGVDDMTVADDLLSPYTPSRFLKSHGFAIGVFVFCECAVAIMLAAFNVQAGLIAATCVLMAVCFILALMATYLRRRAFYHSVAETLESLTSATHFSGLLEEPAPIEEHLLWETGDVLARRSAAEVLQSKQELESYRRYIELWVHEVKTPVTAMRLMLARRPDEFAAGLLHELERTETYIEQALYFARSSAVAADYEIKEVPLLNAARAACKKHAHFLIEQGATPEFAIPAELTVLTDEPWLLFIIGQIITNSAKYDATEIVFSAEEHDGNTPRGRTVLEIRDNGRGIPAADVPRVFDFGFTGRTGRAQGSATGMGLYLVARLCRAMGMHVGLASEQGVGTRVIFTFPHDRKRWMALVSGGALPDGETVGPAASQAEPNDHVSQL